MAAITAACTARIASRAAGAGETSLGDGLGMLPRCAPLILGHDGVGEREWLEEVDAQRLLVGRFAIGDEDLA